MDMSVVVVAREDGGGAEGALRLARLADDLGYGELWVGEGPTWDSFALATGVGLATRKAELTAGPVPVSVRDPATIARGAASVSALIGRPVGVALGTASKRVVEKLHGRSRARAVSELAASAEALRGLIDTPAHERHRGDIDREFLRRLSPPTGRLTIAAFGDRAIGVAARFADRMLLDLVSPTHVRELHAKLAAASAGRTVPRLAAWLPAVVDPDEASLREVTRSIVGYLGVAGYREMFVEAGFGDAVDMARRGAAENELLEALPAEAASVVGLVGDTGAVRERLRAYVDAGLDEVALVPATGDDAGGERTLGTLRELATAIA